MIGLPMLLPQNKGLRWCTKHFLTKRLNQGVTYIMHHFKRNLSDKLTDSLEI